MESDEDPVTRLGQPGGARAAAAAILAGNAFPGTPAKRTNPATTWVDHEYTRRKPSKLYTEPVEAEELISDRPWPVREPAAVAARRILGRR